MKTVKAGLLQKYDDDILIVITSTKALVIYFRNTGYKILLDSWFAEKLLDKREKWRRVIETGAAIVRENICSQVYETKHYPPSDNFFKGIQSNIHETVRLFLEKMILTKKRESQEK